jgi:alpha-L-fucosidase 2
MTKGNAASGYSFRGADPHAELTRSLAALPLVYSNERARHVKDVCDVLNKFSLDLGKPRATDLITPTDQLIASYQVDRGNPYLEWIAFNFGRYLLFSSARGALPANLQGKWAFDSSNPWGADYRTNQSRQECGFTHKAVTDANINLQMNYWSAHITNLDVTDSLWNYIAYTWAPRGGYTAKVLYNISHGWVCTVLFVVYQAHILLSGNS